MLLFSRQKGAFHLIYTRTRQLSHAPSLLHRLAIIRAPERLVHLIILSRRRTGMPLLKLLVMRIDIRLLLIRQLLPLRRRAGIPDLGLRRRVVGALQGLSSAGASPGIALCEAIVESGAAGMLCGCLFLLLFLVLLLEVLAARAAGLRACLLCFFGGGCAGEGGARRESGGAKAEGECPGKRGHGESRRREERDGATHGEDVVGGLILWLLEVRIQIVHFVIVCSVKE